jgi:hypothetical protein
VSESGLGFVRKLRKPFAKNETPSFKKTSKEHKIK